MGRALKGNKQGRKWENLVGYSCEELRNHLEKLFKIGMTWEIFLQGKIHIDHIIPRSWWIYESPDDSEFKQCWALCNLQPLWNEDNIKKSNKVVKQ